jgi:hypothetical protein
MHIDRDTLRLARDFSRNRATGRSLVRNNEAQLRRFVKNYASYYNQVRTHLSPEKNAPDFWCPKKLGPSQPYQPSAVSIINTFGFRF